MKLSWRKVIARFFLRTLESFIFWKAEILVGCRLFEFDVVFRIIACKYIVQLMFVAGWNVSRLLRCCPSIHLDIAILCSGLCDGFREVPGIVRVTVRARGRVTVRVTVRVRVRVIVRVRV